MKTWHKVVLMSALIGTFWGLTPSQTYAQQAVKKEEKIEISNDLYVRTSEGVSVYRNNGSGDFSLVDKFSVVDGSSGDAVIADFDGVNGADVFVLSGSSVYFHYNDGSGNLVCKDVFKFPSDVHSIGSFDLGSDGLIDLYVRTSEGVSIYRNQKTAMTKHSTTYNQGK